MTDAFRLWAEALGDALGDLRGLRLLDSGRGTGRWMRTARGARVCGFDGEAVRAGWRRTFFQGGETIEIPSSV